MAYLLSLVEEIRSGWNVDPRRVHFAGWSNGGFMSHRMACEAAETVAAIASFAGAVHSDPAFCTPGSPVHVLNVHGTADDIVSFNGGFIAGVRHPSVDETIDRWLGWNGCMGESTTSTLDLVQGIGGAETTVETYMNCDHDGSVELWRISGGNHLLYLNNPAFSRELVEWLLAHPKAPPPVAAPATSTWAWLALSLGLTLVATALLRGCR